MLQASCRLTCRSRLFSGLHCRQQMSGKQEKRSRFSIFLRWDIRNHSKVYSASRNTVNSVDSPHIPLNVTMNFMLVCLEGFFWFALGLVIWLGLVWFGKSKCSISRYSPVPWFLTTAWNFTIPSLVFPFLHYFTCFLFFCLAHLNHLCISRIYLQNFR